MKTFVGISVLFLVSMIFVTTTLAQGPGCSSGKRNDGIYYTDCYPIGGDPDDTNRLQTAVAAANGKLIFNEAAYYVSDTISVHSYLTIEGGAPVGTGGTANVIHSLSSNKPVFKIGEDIHEVAIRDLGLYNEHDQVPPITDTSVGILALGRGSGFANSTNIEFSNLRIEFFNQGIFVNSYPNDTGWQFDNVHLENSVFSDCETAIHTAANNTGWQINSIGIASAEGQNGIWFERIGYASLNMVVGNGTPSHGIGTSGTFIQLDNHGTVSIQNCNGEAFQKHLVINGFQAYKQYPVVLINNVLPSCPIPASADVGVMIHNASVRSEGNNYFCSGDMARPQIIGWTDVTSSNDKFCGEPGAADCYPDAMTGLKSEWAVLSNQATLNVDYSSELDELFSPVTEIMASIETVDKTPQIRPLLTLTALAYASGPAPVKYKYDFTRNPDSGRLEVGGDQGAPDVGYVFKNGPVQLQSSTQGSLSSYNTSADTGSMIYCSNCTAGTNPCSTAGGGGGALALKVASGNWACK